MKKLMMIATLLLTTGTYANELNLDLNLDDLGGFGINRPDPRFVKKEESPWPGAVTSTKTIHQKEVELEFTSFKVTTLGYGALTPKVISQELAQHTVLDHRNIGEEGPCLAGTPSLPGTSLTPKLPARELVSIELRNKFVVNEEKKVCQVFLEEIVKTTIEGKVFSHHLSKDMGFRFIDDCK